MEGSFEAAARFAGSPLYIDPDPGACAPGFTLSRASRALHDTA